jgi:hypothetical protein
MKTTGNKADPIKTEEEEEQKNQINSENIVKKSSKDISELSDEGQALYNAVVTNNYDNCFDWLSNNVKNPNAQECILQVSEYVENNHLDINQLTDMNGAAKFILMTEVLTGFSNETFASLISDGERGPKFVEMAGRLSLAAEDAILNERDHLVETIQVQNNITRNNEINYAKEVSKLEKQIKQLNVRLVEEIEQRKKLVRQLEEFPPERISSLQVANERLETLLSQAKDDHKKILDHSNQLKQEFDVEKLQALGQMEAKHCAEMKSYMAKVKIDIANIVKGVNSEHENEVNDLLERHEEDKKLLKAEHEEALLALAEIHQDRLQDAEMEKLRALGIAEAKHKDIQKRLRKEIKRTRMNSNERASSMKAEHVRMVADMETSHRKNIQFLQLQLLQLRRESNMGKISIPSSSSFGLNPSAMSNQLGNEYSDKKMGDTNVFNVNANNDHFFRRYHNHHSKQAQVSSIEHTTVKNNSNGRGVILVDRNKFSPSPRVDITTRGNFVIMPPKNSTYKR